MSRTFSLIALAAALALSGCQRPIRGFQPAANPLEIDAAEYDRVYQASIDVLRDHGFRVDRRDYRFGTVTSAPEPSPSLLEPWVAHNTTGEQVLGSTLQHRRRVARVVIEPAATAATQPADESTTGDPAPAPEAYLLRVEVVVEDEQLPLQRLTMASQGDRHSSIRAVPQEWEAQGITRSYWLPIGRDPYLEQRLIRDIVDRSLQIPESEAFGGDGGVGG